MLSRFLIAFALLGLAAPAAAQPFPSKPLRIVVPFPAGSATDTITRILGGSVSQAIGQPVVVDNKAGADGAIAASEVAKAAPDGYTMLMATNSPMSVVPAMKKSPPYDPVADFTPITDIGRYTFFVVVHPDVPAKTLQELIGFAKANPGKLNYATGNTTGIVSTALFQSLAGIQMVHVPYKGDAPLTLDLVGGRVQLAFATPGSAAPQVKEGKLRCLAAMFPTRAAILPDCPTAAEAGLGKMSLTPWGGVFGPKGMPKEAVDRLQRELAVILKRPDVHEQFGKLAFAPRSSTPEELSALLKQQIESWTSAAREAGIQPE